MYKPTSVGERGRPCLTLIADILCHVDPRRFVFLHTLWYTLLLQIVINVLARLVVGGVPKACHVKPC
jgi:hypothetical protein